MDRKLRIEDFGGDQEKFLAAVRERADSVTLEEISELTKKHSVYGGPHAGIRTKFKTKLTSKHSPIKSGQRGKA